MHRSECLDPDTVTTLWLIVRKELTLAAWLRQVQGCLVVSVGLSLSLGYVMQVDLRSTHEEYFANRLRYSGQAEASHFFRLNAEGVRVDRPPRVTQIMAKGVERTLARSAVVGAGEVPHFSASVYSDPGPVLFPSLDLVYIAATIMTFMAFVVAHGAVVGELSQGTLALQLTYPVSRSHLLLGKYLAGNLVILPPFLLCAAIVLLFSYNADEVQYRVKDLLTIGIGVVVCMIHLCGMVALALTFSVFAASRQGAFGGLLVFWTVAAMVVPNLAPHLAEAISPTPSPHQLERQLRESVLPSEQELTRLWRDLPKRMGAMDNPGRAGLFSRFQEEREQLRREMLQASSKIRSAYRQKVMAQARIVEAIHLLAPGGLLGRVVADLSGNGLRDEERLIDALYRYSHAVEGYIAGSTFGAPDTELPHFALQARTLGDRLAHSSIDILGILLHGLSFLVLSHLGFVRKPLISE